MRHPAGLGAGSASKGALASRRSEMVLIEDDRMIEYLTELLAAVDQAVVAVTLRRQEGSEAGRG